MRSQSAVVMATAGEAALVALRKFLKTGGEVGELRLVGDLEVSVEIRRHEGMDGIAGLLEGPEEVLKEDA